VEQDEEEEAEVDMIGQPDGKTRWLADVLVLLGNACQLSAFKESGNIGNISFHRCNLMENLDSLYTIVDSPNKQNSSPFFLLPALVLHHSALGARLTTS